VGPYATCRYALLEVRPATGRTHQIRRHLRGVSHPVVGDTTYGDGKHNRFFRRHFGCRRLLLAAVEIRFPHPGTGRPTTITAPLSEDFGAVLRRIGWEEAVPARWRSG
jgi:tRNA pseudouridine65 synthase